MNWCSPELHTGPGRFISRLLPVASLVAALGAAQASAQDYEIWALDQGLHSLHIYSSDLEEIESVDLGAAGVQVPHMIDFTSDGAYAFIASTGSNDVTVISTDDREIVAQLETGPRTHMAAVKPDDSAVIADVIGSADDYRDGKLVEIVINEDGTFEIGRELLVAEDPVFTESEDRFNDVAPICHDYTQDSRFAYVTLGPSLDDGGLVVLDTEAFELTRVFPPDVLAVNCGTMLSPDGQHMFVNGGGPETGTWYVIDTATNEVVHEADSRGYDAHGVWVVPDGSELWMVNRVSDNVIIIDPETFEITEEIEEGFGETPDIIGMSPDSRYAFITLRGPNPVSAPHVAVGSSPGFSVVDIAQRELVEIIEPNAGNPDSDFHGIGVRVIQE